MKTVFKIINLAERLSDAYMNIGVDITHYSISGQKVDVRFYQWGERSNIKNTNTLLSYDYTPDEILHYLELIEFHGFRQQEEAA